MPRSPWEIVLWVLVVVFPWLLVRAEATARPGVPGGHVGNPLRIGPGAREPRRRSGMRR